MTKEKEEKETEFAEMSIKVDKAVEKERKAMSVLTKARDRVQTLESKNEAQLVTIKELKALKGMGRKFNLNFFCFSISQVFFLSISTASH